MQLTTVGKEIWRAARKAEQLEEAGADNPAVQERLRKLELVEALRKREVDWPEIKELVGISRATYYRWKRRLQEEGLKGLAPKPRRPRRLRQKVCWTPDLLVRIEALRKQHPTWGRWPIWLTLRRQLGKQFGEQCRSVQDCQVRCSAQECQVQGQVQDCQISERTVGRILAYLERWGRVESIASFLARARRGKLRRRKRRPYARRKPRAYQVNHPGDLVQIDTLTVTLGPGEVVKHFSAVDLSTRFSLAEAHTRATANLAAGFLSELLAKTPFPVRAIQVDGGSEFMAEFEEACQQYNVKLFVLPPKSPKLNGYVERMQRTFKDEFYTRPLPSRIPELQQELNAYLDYYNRRRPHRALDGLAPLEFLAMMQGESVPEGGESQM